MIREGSNSVPGRKINSFIRALEGDKDAVVVDIWVCKAFGMLKERKLKRSKTGKEVDYVQSLSDKDYDKMESFCRCVAKLMNIEARQFQSMLWAGSKREHSKVSNNVSWSDILVRKRGAFNYF